MDFTTGELYSAAPPRPLQTSLAIRRAFPAMERFPRWWSSILVERLLTTNIQILAHGLGLLSGPMKQTAVRGAFGIVYDNWNATVQTSQNIGGSWPGTGLQQLTNLNQPTPASPTPTVQAQNPFGSTSFLPPATPFTSSGTFYDPHNKNPTSNQFNLSIERLFGQSATVTLSYAGSTTVHFVTLDYYNTALTPGPGNPQLRAPFPYMVPTDYSRNVGNASYNAFMFSLNKRYSNGLAYQVAYTWSKNIDAGSDGFAAGEPCQQPYDFSAYGCIGVAGNNLTNFLAVNLVYQVPVGQGKLLSTGNKVADYILGNWQVNGIFIAHSGIPFFPMVTSDIANTGNSGYMAANLVGNPHLQHRNAAEWFNRAAYVVPPAYTFGTTPRNSLRGPDYWDLDSSVFRQFPVGERWRFEFRAEAFNTLNNVNLGQPRFDVDVPSTFGTIDTTANTARELQLGAKIIF